MPVRQEHEGGAAGEDVRFRSGSASFRLGIFSHRGGGGGYDAGMRGRTGTRIKNKERG